MGNGDRHSVLLIEDNPGDARLIELMLSEEPAAPFELRWADRLSRGLELLSRETTVAHLCNNARRTGSLTKKTTPRSPSAHSPLDRGAAENKARA